jgi:WhiB family redox-sensing transcriptional regulator
MQPDAPDEPLELSDFLRRPEWHSQALCRGTTRTFFSGAPATLEKARAIRRGCPVRLKYFECAMANPDLEGVWAGFTQKERKEIRRRRAVASTPRNAVIFASSGVLRMTEVPSDLLQQYQRQGS